MRCPYCGQPNTRVTDSRPVDDDRSIRRRRECIACGRRFTTWEKIEVLPLTVVKKDGMRVPFDAEKILEGIRKACYKRPVPASLIEEEVQKIESILLSRGESEVTTHVIGELVMNMLKDVDAIAYVRFASVYREFKDAESLMEEIRHIVNSSKG